MDNKNYHFHNLGKGKTIVLLNGLFASHSSWDLCLDILKEDFNVLQMNFFGQGILKFDQLKKINLQSHTDQLIELLDLLGLEKVTLLGLSHGGRVALNMASQCPDRIELIVACNTYLNPDQILCLKMKSWKKAAENGSGKDRFDVALPWVWGKSFIQENMELIDSYRNRSDLLCQKLSESLIDQALMKHTFNFNNYTGQVLLGYSREDLLTPKYYQEAIQCRFDLKHQVSLFELNGGHASLIEYPEQVTRIKNIIKTFYIEKSDGLKRRVEGVV